MDTIVIPISPQAYLLAVETIRRGGLVAFPTDTVYGVGASAFDGRAIESIYLAKDRPVEKAIPVLIGETGDLERVARDVPEMARILMAHFWPGALTVVVLKQPDLPEAVSAINTVGVRLPDHEVARKLLRAAGPMAVTSANLSGQSNPCTAAEVLEQLGERIPLILDGGTTPGGIPSTVVDCSGESPQILREGAIKKAQIEALIGLF